MSAYALTCYKRFMADVKEKPMRIGRCKGSAHAHRHGGSMGAYGNFDDALLQWVSPLETGLLCSSKLIY